jgi:predicted nucleotide-binding protein
MFELGYLLGRLGARRVCGLLPRGVELPFPISGATILTLDAGGAWRDGLASVLRSASD